MDEEELKSTMKELYAPTGGRNSSDIFQHYLTCNDAFIDYQVALIKLIRNRDPELRTELLLKQVSCRNVVVVFSHLFLEATIYDYGATNLSDSYVKKYVEKLNFLSTWVVIPRLVTGKSFPTDSRAYQLLGRLTKARNALAHFKTRRMSDASALETIHNMDGQVGPSECFDCMSEALRELSGLGSKRWLPFQWGAVRYLVDKEYRQVEEAVTKQIQLALHTPCANG